MTQQVGRKSTRYYDKVPDDMSVNKAGFIIFGDVTEKSGRARSRPQEAERHVVAAWNEGRFKDKKIGYQLPKGSVDGVDEEIESLTEYIRLNFSAAKSGLVEYAIQRATGERERSDGTTQAMFTKEQLASFIAGMRESYEETGVNIIELLGPENLVTLFDEGKLENAVSSEKWGSPEIKIKGLALAPVDDMKSLNRDGTLLRTQLFAMQLEDNEIAKLNNKDHIKNHGSISQFGKDKGFTVKEPARRVRDGIHKPNKDQVLEWLSTGKMPPAPWNSTAGVSEEMNGGERIANITGVLEGNEDGSYFRGVVKKAFADPDFNVYLASLGMRDEFDVTPEIRSNREFGELFQFLATKYPEDRKKIKGLSKQMRDTCIDLGVIDGDLDTHKMDTNDTPGMIYQEGAQVMPLKDFFLYSVALTNESISYDNVMGGHVMLSKDKEWAVDLLDENDQMRPSTELLYHKYAHSQIGMLSAIARAEDLEINDPARIKRFNSVKYKDASGEVRDSALDKEAAKEDFSEDVTALSELRQDLQAQLMQNGHPLAAANQNQQPDSAMARINTIGAEVGVGGR